MTRLEIHNLCREYNIKKYIINDDMSINTIGGVDLSGRKLTQIPIKFKEVGGYFYCYNNQLTSLEYCPETVDGDFSCSNNQLTSLKYCPETVGGGFNCYRNQLTNFDGLPEFFEQSIYLEGNPVYEIYRLFNQDPRCIYWIREYDVIMDMTVVEYRLEEVFHTLGISIPKDIKLKEYILV